MWSVAVVGRIVMKYRAMELLMNTSLSISAPQLAKDLPTGRDRQQKPICRDWPRMTLTGTDLRHRRDASSRPCAVLAGIGLRRTT